MLNCEMIALPHRLGVDVRPLEVGDAVGAGGGVVLEGGGAQVAGQVVHVHEERVALVLTASGEQRGRKNL